MIKQIIISLAAISVAFTYVFAFALCKVSGDCSRYEEENYPEVFNK